MDIYASSREIGIRPRGPGHVRILLLLLLLPLLVLVLMMLLLLLLLTNGLCFCFVEHKQSETKGFVYQRYIYKQKQIALFTKPTETNK